MTTSGTTATQHGLSTLMGNVLVDFGRLAWVLTGVPDPALLVTQRPWPDSAQRCRDSARGQRGQRGQR